MRCFARSQVRSPGESVPQALDETLKVDPTADALLKRSGRSRSSHGFVWSPWEAFCMPEPL